LFLGADKRYATAEITSTPSIIFPIFFIAIFYFQKYS
jgi:hypothetical protein